MSRYRWPRSNARSEDGDDPLARARFMSRRRTDFDLPGALAAGRAPLRAAAERAARNASAVATAREHLWQPLGPSTVVRGQAEGAPRVTGRVRAIAVDPSGVRVYAAAAGGGVWYSSDSGDHWRSVGGFASTLASEIDRPAQRHSCGALYVAFGADESLDDVFVGTGETSYVSSDAQPGSQLRGIGILFAHGPAVSTEANPWQREAPKLLGFGVNRFAAQPGGTTLVAATSAGLRQRPTAPGADVDWDPVAGTPFNLLTDEISDVLWTASTVTAPARLWVWVRRGPKRGLWVRSDSETNFTEVTTPHSRTGRGVLAATTPATTVYAFHDRNDPADRRGDTSPALYQLLSGAETPTATFVENVPNVLGDIGFWSLALAVDPTHPQRVVLGGSTFTFDSPQHRSVGGQGAIVAGDVGMASRKLTFGAVAPPMMLGLGVHADVHDLEFSADGNRLWVGCDGGVWRSDAPRKPVAFVPCNTELPVVESNYVASHPTCEGFVVAGLQDNGVIVRRTNGVWVHTGPGDAGSIVFDMKGPTRFMRQHVRGRWFESNGVYDFELDLLGRRWSTGTTEDKASAFYSTAASIAHWWTSARSWPPDTGQVIVGTTRVWFTQDFGAKWVTLPKGESPPLGDLTQDAFGEAITVCRWQTSDVAWVLGEGTLMRYARVPGSDSATSAGTWSRENILRKNAKQKKDTTSADGPIRDSAVWTDIAVNLDPPAADDQPPVQHGTKGAIYLGTIGKVGDTNVDTLWWFDGTSKWWKTGLRAVVPAPVTAIVCDAHDPSVVYVGTTVGVWRGLRVQLPTGDPVWAWDTRLNGLPEAAVEDLTIFSDGGLRLLRAAIASRGIWELRLDATTVVDLTYVRAHDDDLRYRARATETGRDCVTARSWHGSPDVRPRRAPLPVAPPASLPWTFGRQSEDLRRFQAALRAKLLADTRDARVRATGKWDLYFNEVLRDLGAPFPTAAADVVGIDVDFWNLSVTHDGPPDEPPYDTAEPWGAGSPNEADLYDLSADLVEGDLQRTSCTLPAADTKVDVVVHHRGLGPIDGANVRVTLLSWMDPAAAGTARWDDSTTWFTADVPWTLAVNQVLNRDSPVTIETVGDGWRFVGTTDLTRRQTLTGQTIEPQRPGIATFDLSLNGLAPGRVVLLVAVIRAGTTAADDIALTPATLQELVLANANVAVRSLRVG